MKRITIRELRKLAPVLQAALGSYWTTQVWTKDECEYHGDFDPPCACLEASCAMGSVMISVDGEWSIGFGYSELEGKVASCDDWYEKIISEILIALRP